ncbi:MAG: hypothetical protein IPK35_12050 [Saprospiraceae bacterium]|jgi:hypothetical protein|nr:hypothetical protein [Saprospiraceae bacterium]
MNIRAHLLTEHSKAITDSIVHCVQANPDKLGELMACFFDPNLRICQRAAWSVGILGKKNPEMMYPYLPDMINYLQNPPHDAIIRNTVRTWQTMKVPEEYQGEIFEICFKYIIHPKYPAAIRAFSMSVCTKIAKEIPELKEELILAISDQLEFGSSGIINRGNRMIKELSK